MPISEYSTKIAGVFCVYGKSVTGDGFVLSAKKLNFLWILGEKSSGICYAVGNKAASALCKHQGGKEGMEYIVEIVVALLALAGTLTERNLSKDAF